MGPRVITLLVTLTAFFYSSYGCQMEGVNNWNVPIAVEINDVFRGSFFNRTTNNIQAISAIIYGEGLNQGPYITPSYSDSVFNLATNAAYENYEEFETSQSMTITVSFQCSTGSTSVLVFIISVRDTNNNSPQFLPTEEYDFTIATPVPPGFLITGCLNNIIARDIDLTTQRIEFEIDENPYFEIAYDAAASTVAKEFHATIRTTTFIRALPEDIELTITATDVDLTGDPQLTRTAVVRIQGDAEFELPEEPVFSQPYYTASYTATHEIDFQQPISLQQGYHTDVVFNLEGDYSGNFELVTENNQISLRVTTPLSDEVLRDQQIIIVVRASRNNTSGDTATVIVELPTVLGLEFSQVQYEGSIVDNVLLPLALTLARGYEDGYDVNITGEYSTFFSSTVQENTITLTMSPLDTSILEANHFISLQVLASNEYSSATTVVTLSIIKDDNTTPRFERSLYSGTYEPSNGLILEQIILEQGFDDSVIFQLEGEYVTYFAINQDGNYVNVTATALPTDLFIEQHVLLTIRATKPRSVDGTAVISISLPEARELRFEVPFYSGTLQDNELALETIVLSSGYDEDVNFTLAGEHASYFATSNIQNQITITLSTPLPDSIILENSFITLTLTASGVHATPTTAAIVLEIIKQDITTPVFSQNIYRASYLGDFNIEYEYISLVQGYDSDVIFSLEGEHSQYFSISNTTGNNVMIHLLAEIPEEIIFEEKVIVFNILAQKALSVGANAAIALEFPRELTEPIQMRFSQTTYTGTLDNGNLTLENIVLETGFVSGTEFILFGDYAEYFTTLVTNNVVTIALNTTVSLPTEALENSLIILELEARRERGNALTSIVIQIIREDEVIPQFINAYFRGAYDFEDGLSFEDTITLSQGYDETVVFSLEGDSAIWFDIESQGNSASLLLSSAIPVEIVENNSHLLFTVVATKPNGIQGRAAISIDLSTELLAPTLLRFAQNTYMGRLQNGEIQVPTISLLSENVNITLDITGEYAAYFELVRDDFNNITVTLTDELPNDIIEENTFIVLDITASYPEAFSGYTTLVIEIIKTQIEPPIFEEAYYIGEYSEQDGLLFEHLIRLIQGFDDSVSFTLAGDDAQWFELVNNGSNLSLVLSSTIDVKDRSHLVFSVMANKTNSVPGQTAIIITLTDFYTNRLGFSQLYYLGTIENGNLTTEQIILDEGYDSDINFTLSGDHAEYFQLTHQAGIFTIQLLSGIPADVIETNDIVILSLEVETIRDRTHATVVLEVIKPDSVPLAFNEDFYVGSYSETQGFTFEPQITLASGYDDTVSFTLQGDSAQWFELVFAGNNVTLSAPTPIPSEILVNNRHLIFVIRAEKERSTTVTSTIVIEIVGEVPEELAILSFERNSYVGVLSGDEVDIEIISLTQGYSENVTFVVRGDLVNYFNISNEGPNVTISVTSALTEELIPDNRIIVLELQAVAFQSISALATIVFEVQIDNIITPVFEQVYYVGEYSSSEGLMFENLITLREGYDESVVFNVQGVGTQWISPIITGNSISLEATSPIPQDILENIPQLVLVVTAQKPGIRNSTTIAIITLINDLPAENAVSFDKILYEGVVENGSVEHEEITVFGYNGTNVQIFGEFSDLFVASFSEGTVTVQSVGLPSEFPDVTFIALELRVDSAGAVLLFEVRNTVTGTPSPPTENVTFEKSLYEGLIYIQNGTVQHEAIIVSGYEGSNIEVFGGFADVFQATISGGIVTVEGISLESLPDDVSFIALELRVSNASAVLVLTFYQTTPPPSLPTVTFSSEFYTIRVDTTQTGLLGRVFASADNGETVTYALEQADLDAHLIQRLTVDSEGGLFLSAPANSGVYDFQVLATTTETRVTATTMVQLTVEAIMVCGDDIIVPPLIILERDEEAPYQNLVPLNTTNYPGCQYSITNRWPLDQTWLYVDENGLHSLAIDREHESIAFMALSQVQVELILECNGDNIASRKKRSLISQSRHDNLGPYDYGNMQWIISESIAYNPRRTLVNLIVNDINDNAPVFVGKENEPIVVGYPVPEIEERVLPRALVVLEATDADVGENARLVYWSSEEVLAVSPNTGFVHVRADEQLENNMLLTVNTTDRNGVDGLTGSIQIMVKLVDTNHIAVVTVRDAFLSDERYILTNISEALGYEVKSLSSTVISNNAEGNSRNKREITSAGALLQIYIYGLIEQEPVEVNRLTEDISNSFITTVDVVRTVSLEDYLEGLETCVVQNTGLLVSTIVLSVLFFILIVAVTVWFILTRIIRKNYEQFSDKNSIDSRESTTVAPKPEALTKPRLNIEELKRSERKLQERLEAPVVVTTAVVEPQTSSLSKLSDENREVIVPDPQPTIVIQSIDKLKRGDDSDEDEFGEKVRNKRKSVVTFNENVEKIIHVEDPPEDTGSLEDFEVYKF